ncbi:hypothetical protein [Paludibaculum fermentans]|uniref:Uncharacterized protein n=1 Tax=Paludibaculum fermentans TaxID=1473598 RepID=A0A7S7NT49_PALFE|nr:hypothetical protein [Paludibaculum fermentans]QOY89307.1 hypothetical protein IRI77_04945 [Paludibaculum fermentans]
MTFPTMEAVSRLRGLLAGEWGLGPSMTALQGYYGLGPEVVEGVGVGVTRAPAELQEKAGSTRYPVIQTYCDQIENKRSEQFRVFSGRMRVVTEVRVSSDRLEGTGEKLHFYVDAVRDVLERNAGCLGEGVFLEPGYEVGFDAVKKGGLNFMQVGRVVCWLGVSR